MKKRKRKSDYCSVYCLYFLDVCQAGLLLGKGLCGTQCDSYHSCDYYEHPVTYAAYIAL